jgi:hypothetical protein
MNDDGGAPSIDGGEPVDAATPRVMPGGLVTSPRRGDVVDEASAAPIVVRGVVVDPMLPVAVLRLEPDGAERLVAMGLSDVVADRNGGYPFSVDVPAQGQSVWPTGGLLRLRVADGRGRRLGVLERDERVCLTCGNDVPLTLVSSPSLSRVDTLTRYLELKGRPSVAEAELYYQTADLPETLDAFVARYFADATDEAVGVYYNAGDLAIGRELHCASRAARCATRDSCRSIPARSASAASTDTPPTAIRRKRCAS